MKSDRSKIEAAKATLPLPDLLRRLGFHLPASGEGNMASPFAADRRQKTPSFSIFQRGDGWGWCDRSNGGEEKGDEITFLEKLESLSRADAIARYLALAGVEDRCSGQASVASKPAETTRTAPAPSSLDWSAVVAKFTATDAARIATWRGYSREFVEWLHKEGLIGICNGCIAFPVHNVAGEIIAAHARPESGRWFYTPKGAGSHPLIIGNIADAAKVMVFESQWDAFGAMDVAGWHRAVPEGWAVLITRGASNGRFASRAGGAVYAFPQNDPEKDGRRAGEEWMREVAASAKGIVYRVSTPANCKDFNEWTQAEKVDVLALLAAAPPESKPKNGSTNGEKKNLPQSNGSGTPSSAPFNALGVLEELDLHWLNGSQSYFIRADDGAGRVRYLEMGSGDIRRKLRTRGYRARPDPESNETVSHIDRILDAATEHRVVDFAINIAGTPAGVHSFPGGRVLVRESSRLIEPRPGPCSTIIEFLTALLGKEGVERFIAWLKISVEALRAGERRPGQALIIVGPPDCGKSRIQHQIITPLLGGRNADPKSYFFGRTDFNAELIGAEHLLIEEIPSSSRHEDRQFFGERIKEVVANDTARLHKKNKDACTVSPFWRLSITLNDDPEKLRCLPPLTDDLVEKIIMLEAERSPEFWKRFDEATDPRKAFRDAINSELPAFAQMLLQYSIPERLKGRRYGVASYIPAEIAEMLFDNEPENLLRTLIDKANLFEDGAVWEGDAEDLKQKLCAKESAVHASACRLLGNYPTACGQYLARLATRFPARFQKHRTATKRSWIIKPPQQ